MAGTQVFGFKEHVLWQWDHESALVRRFVNRVTGDLTDGELNWQSVPGVHSIWHQVWHMFLSLDHYFSHAFAIKSCWDDGGWASRMDLSGMQQAFDYPGLVYDYLPRFTICEVPDTLVDELRAPPLADFLKYVDGMLARCRSVLEKASEEDLCTEFFAYGRMAPRVTAARFEHVYRHLGMMEFTRGLIRGPGG